MSITKKSKIKHLKKELGKELIFLKNILSVMKIPSQSKGDSDDLDYEIVTSKQNEIKDFSKRARNITELEEKLQKMKSKNNFNLKNKLVKKSLSSKLNKTIKKKERLNKSRMKPKTDDTLLLQNEKSENEHKPKVKVGKPVFNTDGKLVFSKFDFAHIGRKDKISKGERDPKKILNTLKEQEQKILTLEETGDSKAKELKERIAWKNVLQKAEGLKVKDDPTLLKKSIKKMEQKKKQSKKKWETRIQGVEQKKEERQKKRKENINKKKKEKKSKIIKASMKKGRVVI